MNEQRHPLHWPMGWPRTKNPKRSNFSTSFTNARDGLMDEIRLLGGRNAILSTNIELRRDGLPYASHRNPEDAGVAVYFTRQGVSQVMACDRWTKVEENIQSLRKTIEAMRGMERWGSSEILNRMFTGFQALSDGKQTDAQGWWTVLGVSLQATIDEIESAYKSKSKIAHPDLGGSVQDMTRLNLAVSEARAEKGKI